MIIVIEVPDDLGQDYLSEATCQDPRVLAINLGVLATRAPWAWEITFHPDRLDALWGMLRRTSGLSPTERRMLQEELEGRG